MDADKTARERQRLGLRWQSAAATPLSADTSCTKFSEPLTARKRRGALLPAAVQNLAVISSHKTIERKAVLKTRAVQTLRALGGAR